MRLKFSLRTILIVLAVLCGALACSIRFGPHILWVIVDSDGSSNVHQIPSKALVSGPSDSPFVTCQVGPLSFALPESLSKNVDVESGLHGQLLVFDDANRVLSFQIPYRYEGFFTVPGASDFPEKAEWTAPRIHKAILDAASSDFSFAMSHEELRWHKYLLKQRSLRPTDIKSIEYLWRQDLEATLISTGDSWLFEWSTIDRKWMGKMHFMVPSTSESEDWIRQVCTTFTLNGNPAIFDNLDDKSVELLVSIRPQNSDSSD